MASYAAPCKHCGGLSGCHGIPHNSIGPYIPHTREEVNMAFISPVTGKRVVNYNKPVNKKLRKAKAKKVRKTQKASRKANR